MLNKILESLYNFLSYTIGLALGLSFLIIATPVCLLYLALINRLNLLFFPEKSNAMPFFMQVTCSVLSLLSYVPKVFLDFAISPVFHLALSTRYFLLKKQIDMDLTYYLLYPLTFLAVKIKEAINLKTEDTNEAIKKALNSATEINENIEDILDNEGKVLDGIYTALRCNETYSTLNTLIQNQGLEKLIISLYPKTEAQNNQENSDSPLQKIGIFLDEYKDSLKGLPILDIISIVTQKNNTIKPTSSEREELHQSLSKLLKNSKAITGNELDSVLFTEIKNIFNLLSRLCYNNALEEYQQNQASKNLQNFVDPYLHLVIKMLPGNNLKDCKDESKKEKMRKALDKILPRVCDTRKDQVQKDKNDTFFSIVNSALTDNPKAIAMPKDDIIAQQHLLNILGWIADAEIFNISKIVTESVLDIDNDQNYSNILSSDSKGALKTAIENNCKTLNSFLKNSINEMDKDASDEKNYKNKRVFASAIIEILNRNRKSKQPLKDILPNIMQLISIFLNHSQENLNSNWQKNVFSYLFSYLDASENTDSEKLLHLVLETIDLTEPFTKTLLSDLAQLIYNDKKKLLDSIVDLIDSIKSDNENIRQQIKKLIENLDSQSTAKIIGKLVRQIDIEVISDENLKDLVTFFQEGDSDSIDSLIKDIIDNIKKDNGLGKNVLDILMKLKSSKLSKEEWDFLQFEVIVTLQTNKDELKRFLSNSQYLTRYFETQGDNKAALLSYYAEGTVLPLAGKMVTALGNRISIKAVVQTASAVYEQYNNICMLKGRMVDTAKQKISSVLNSLGYQACQHIQPLQETASRIKNTARNKVEDVIQQTLKEHAPKYIRPPHGRLLFRTGIGALTRLAQTALSKAATSSFVAEKNMR